MFYNKKLKNGIEEPSRKYFRPIYRILYEIRLDFDTLENSINQLQEEILQTDLNKSIRIINDEIHSKQQIVLAKYATMLRTYGEDPLGLLDDEVERIIAENQADWHFYEADWLLEQPSGKTSLNSLLNLINIRLKTLEVAIIQDFAGLMGGREMHCFWNTLKIHAKQCQVKLGDTFEAEIGIAKYPIAIHPSKWSLTVDNISLKSEKYDIPVYKKKATHLGWHEFTVVYKTGNVLTGEPIKDEFMYRYEVVR